MIQNPQFQNSDIKKYFEFNYLDLRNILEEITQPALMVNFIDGQVISTNYLFSELVQIGIVEISGLRIYEILPAIDLKKINDGEKINVTVSLKNNQTLEVKMSTSFISHAENLLLLIFEEDRKGSIETENSWEEFAKEQTVVLSKIKDFSYTELLAQIIKIGKQITFFDEVVFYLTQEATASLKRFPSDSSNFPDQIPAMELNRIKEIDFWEPGKRVLSEIHRAGRLKKFASIVTIPVSGDGRQFGLLIAASRNPNDLKAKIDLLKQFSAWVSTTIVLFEEGQKESRDLINLSTKIEKLELFFNNSNDCLLLLDWENQILEFNTNFLNLLDYLPIELLNKNVEIIFDNSPLMSLLNIKQSPINELDAQPMEVFDRHGNKKSVFVKVTHFTSGDDDRKILILKDATEFTALENNLLMLQKNAALGEILAEFSHDVRNIINRLTTGLQLLVKKINPDESAVSSIQDMQNECVGMADLMESVLSFSQQNYEKFQTIDLKEMIERIYYRFQKKANQANISLILNSKDIECLAWIDQRSLERVIINLINNGIEAIGNGGGAVSINLSDSEEHPGYLSIQIADTGPGIPPEIQSNLYQKFSSGKPKGTGLGLFISQKIIEFHKGWIDLETFPGGTIFNIYIPKEKRGDDQ